MPKLKETKNIWLYVVLLLLQLLAIFYIKYSNQSLPFSEFSIYFIGNLFLILVYLCLILAQLFNSLKKLNSTFNGKAISFIIVSWVLLVISFLSTKFDLGLNNIYFFGLPGNKIFTGLLLTSFLIGLFSFLLYSLNILLTKNKPSFIKTLYGSMLMIIIFLLMTFIYNNTLSYASGKWQLNKSNNNVSVVLGAAVWTGNLPSPTLAGRVDKSLELLRNGYSGKILVTGSSAPGEMTEAEVAYNYILANGIDSSKISIETKTTSTSEQVQFIKNELSESENIGEIIVISDSYHLPRVIQISRFFDLNIKVAESRHTLDFKDKLYNKVRESIALFIFWCFAL
ncbi:MAG: YdcF family protein [Ignavibacteriaceae bacterium]|nr:YdcF family protein [Ignavibacteriaceae bacterium]